MYDAGIRSRVFCMRGEHHNLLTMRPLNSVAFVYHCAKAVAVVYWLRCPPRNRETGVLDSRSGHSYEFKIGNLAASPSSTGIIRIALGLFGPVPVYHDWVEYATYSCVAAH